MPTPFANSSIFNHASFTFFVASNAAKVDRFGVPIAADPKEIKLTLKVKKIGAGNIKNLTQSEAASTFNENYECRIVAVNDNYNRVTLPPEIQPGAVGEGTLNNRPCKFTVRSIAQSGVSPIVEKLLGSQLRGSVEYRIRWGTIQ